MVDLDGFVSKSGILTSVVPPTMLDRNRFMAPDTSNRWLLFRLGGDCKDSAGVGAKIMEDRRIGEESPSKKLLLGLVEASLASMLLRRKDASRSDAEFSIVVAISCLLLLLAS